MGMHDDCATREELLAQGDRHHRGLNDISKTMGAMQVTLEMLANHMVGTPEKPGLPYRVTSLEEARKRDEQSRGERKRSEWWAERGTKIFDGFLYSLGVVLVIFLLKMGFQSAIRQEIRETRDELSMALKSRKPPKDPTCPGCAPTVAAAE